MRTIFETERAGYPIKLDQAKSGRFTVTYGLQVKRGLTYENAAHELGECLMHALACEGRIDDGMRG